MTNEAIEGAEETLENAGIKSLDRVTKATRTKIIYDRTHKILGLKSNKR